jgi:hypothetical protein
MIHRIRWWLAYRVAVRRAARARTVTAYALAHREQDRIRYRRP